MTLRKKFILIICLLILVHTVLYYCFYFFAYKKNELLIRSNECQKLNGQYDVLFFGDSHVERSIDEKKMGNRFCSVAYYGENNVMNYYRLKYYFENDLFKPKYIVLPCDVVTFAMGYNLYRTNTFFYYSFIPISELTYFEKDLFSAYYNFFKIKIFPYTEWQYGLNLANPNRVAKGKEKFAERTEAEKISNSQNFVQKELMCSGNSKNLFSPIAIDYLKKTIALCKEHNVKMVFIKFPMTRNLLNEVKYHVDSSSFVSRPSEKIIDAHRIPIVDFERVFINKPELFIDCHHLNIYGKEKFTPLLKQKLDSLLQVY